MWGNVEHMMSLVGRKRPRESSDTFIPVDVRDQCRAMLFAALEKAKPFRKLNWDKFLSSPLRIARPVKSHFVKPTAPQSRDIWGIESGEREVGEEVGEEEEDGMGSWLRYMRLSGQLEEHIYEVSEKAGVRKYMDHMRSLCFMLQSDENLGLVFGLGIVGPRRAAGLLSGTGGRKALLTASREEHEAALAGIGLSRGGGGNLGKIAPVLREVLRFVTEADLIHLSMCSRALYRLVCLDVHWASRVEEITNSLKALRFCEIDDARESGSGEDWMRVDPLTMIERRDSIGKEGFDAVVGFAKLSTSLTEIFHHPTLGRDATGAFAQVIWKKLRHGSPLDTTNHYSHSLHPTTFPRQVLLFRSLVSLVHNTARKCQRLQRCASCGRRGTDIVSTQQRNMQLLTHKQCLFCDTSTYNITKLGETSLFSSAFLEAS